MSVSFCLPHPVDVSAFIIWSGMSAVYMLNSVGDRTPPCGTPVLN